MSTAPIESLPTAERRRLVAIGLLRALATTVLVVAAYYLLPLNNLAGISLGVALAAGLLALTAVVAYQVRAIIRHPHSAVRAIEALAITVPVFLLLFAATYFMMEQANARQLQRRFAHPYRLAVLHGHRLRHGRLWRHRGDQPGGPRGRHRADDPRPARPRPRGQGVRRRCRDRPRTANDAAGPRIVVNSETPPPAPVGPSRSPPGCGRPANSVRPPSGTEHHQRTPHRRNPAGHTASGHTHRHRAAPASGKFKSPSDTVGVQLPGDTPSRWCCSGVRIVHRRRPAPFRRACLSGEPRAGRLPRRAARGERDCCGRCT